MNDFAIPRFEISGDVLDVGCGDGHAFLHPAYATAGTLTGIDPDAQAIRDARDNIRGEYHVGTAESLPYKDASFDIVISRVALPYSDIPKSLAEIHRVLKPGGKFFCSMHDIGHFWRQLKLSKSPRRVMDHGYILAASLGYIATGKVIARPWSGLRETFQNRASLRRDLKRAGFTGIGFERTPKHFLISAQKDSPHAITTAFIASGVHCPGTGTERVADRRASQ